ncbi:MAG: Inositol-1-monophosphatase [Microgenomates bacterium OLB23]|nr:MAG: Inositol-1-monophosphatase [Microgenomates bacterium OLB23]
MLSAAELLQLEQESSRELVKVGTYIASQWEKIHTLTYKDARDSATEVDTASENMLRTALSKLLPQAGFMVEEGTSNPKDELNWVIDPIDGTKQYAHQMPLYTTQFALMHKNIPILGAVYNPVSQQLFSASVGNGLRCNSNNFVPKFNRRVDESIIDVDFGGSNPLTLDARLSVLKQLTTSFFRVRMFAGIYSIYMLTGALDGTISIVGHINIYDYAPHDILLQEAGIKVKYLTHNSIGPVRVAGYPHTLHKLLEVVS